MSNLCINISAATCVLASGNYYLAFGVILYSPWFKSWVFKNQEIL
jgi:hypothetical protein